VVRVEAHRCVSFDEPVQTTAEMYCWRCGQKIAKGSRLVYMNVYYEGRAESVALHEGCAKLLKGGKK
jgi:hypothetical protein